MSDSPDIASEAEDIAHEHRTLMHLVQNVDRLQSDATTASLRWAHEIAVQLDDLSAALISHFSKEEMSALYTTLPDRFPDLAPTTDRLRDEHREILERLTEIRSHCLGEDIAERRDDISTGVRTTVELIRKHEAEETEIILWEYTGGQGI